MLFTRAKVASLTGRVDEARQDAEEGVALAAARGNVWTEVQNRSVLGFLALSVGDLEGVVAALDPGVRVLMGSGVLQPVCSPSSPIWPRP